MLHNTGIEIFMQRRGHRFSNLGVLYKKLTLSSRISGKRCTFTIIRELISRARMCILQYKIERMHLESEPGDLWSTRSSQEDCKLKKVFSGRVSDVWEGFSDWNINTDKWKSNFTCICHIGWAIVRVLLKWLCKTERDGRSIRNLMIHIAFSGGDIPHSYRKRWTCTFSRPTCV